MTSIIRIGIITADIPALFDVSFRAVQQLGSCYRFALPHVKHKYVHAGDGESH